MKLKSKGFILAEAMFSVLITLIVVLMLQNLLKTLTLANKAHHKTDDVVFSYVQLNRFINEEKGIKAYTLPKDSNFSKAVFVKTNKKNETTTYYLTLYKDMVRVTTPKGGHMPLLLNVEKADFLTKDRLIKINVMEKDGRKSELYFKFNSRPNLKKKVVNDKKQKLENKR